MLTNAKRELMFQQNSEWEGISIILENCGYCYHFIKGREVGGTKYEGHLESKERFAIQRYLLITGKKQNMQVL